jgi:hypothetical protein
MVNSGSILGGGDAAGCCEGRHGSSSSSSLSSCSTNASMSRLLPGPGALVLFGFDKAGFTEVGFDVAGWGMGFESKGGDGFFFTTGRENAAGSREGRKGIAGLDLFGESELTLRLSKVREVLTENGASAAVSLFFPSFSGVTLGPMAGFVTLAARGLGLS